MNTAEAIRQLIQAEVEYALCSSSWGSDGHHPSCVSERKAADAAYEKLTACFDDRT
jgi:hypothetical protein